MQSHIPDDIMDSSTDCSTDKTIDKRKAHRQISEIPVWVCLSSATKTSDIKQYDYEASKVKDFSLLGCAIEPLTTPLFKNAVEQDTLVYLYFEEPLSNIQNKNPQDTMITAQVKHADQRYIGLHFESLGTHILSTLQSHLSKAKYF